MIQGMDRGDLLLGASPLDQILAVAGMGQDVDDEKPFALGIDASGDLTVVVPTLDPVRFLERNFEPLDDGRVRHSGGDALHARTVGSRVILSSQAPTDDRLADNAAAWIERSGPRGTALLHDADIAFIGDPATLREMLDDENANPIWQFALNTFSDLAAPEASEAFVVALDLDALALVVRTAAVWQEGTLAARLASGDGPRGSGIEGLPARPFVLAGAVDAGVTGLTRAVEAVAERLGTAAPPEWLRTVRGARFMMPASRSGLAAGALRDAVLHIETSDPEGARAFMRAWIESRAGRRHGFDHLVTLRSTQLEDGTPADSFEVRLGDGAPGTEPLRVAHALLFGRLGWQGMIVPTDDGVLLTFGRRASALEALAASTSGTGLADGGAIRAMRTWMPPDPFVEGYLDITRGAALMQEAVDSYPMLRNLPVPKPDVALPPVGFGAALSGGGIESTTIVPAGVLASFFDAALPLLDRFGLFSP